MKDRAKNYKYDWNRGKMIIQWFSKKKIAEEINM
jgi:hypothetical protein